MEEEKPKYDYDLFVIGGGSGGLACARRAVKLGARVGLANFVKPSPYGTTWGLGGTCVNVGCIPKKLMHFAASLGESKADAQQAGWDLDINATHNWDTMVDMQLNFGYQSSILKEKIDYKLAYATFIDAHTLQLVDSDNQVSQITSETILVSVGLRPQFPEQLQSIKQHLLTSDDIFSLKQKPGSTLCIGASYISLETASFLHSIGFPVDIMVRSILLRGFDRQMADKVGNYMESKGINFLKECVPIKGQKLENGKIEIEYENLKEKKVEKRIYDSVVVATGRIPVIKDMNLEKVGVILKGPKILTNEKEQTNIQNIYAIGDVAYGKPELTPPAIMAGKLLAERLYAGGTQLMDYTNIATTVFTSLEYGTIGLSEEAAIEKFGEENIEVYHTHFKPLEWNYNWEHEDNSCYTKIIVNKADNERVVGFHYLGPNAGEVTQGYAVAIKLGATKHDFAKTVGIHPTCAEEVVGLEKTKKSDPDAMKSGC